MEADGATTFPVLNASRVCLIDIPPKVWRPKVQSRYKLPEYTNDISEGVFDFTHHGKCVYKPKLTWEDRQRDDIISFDEDLHMEDLLTNLRIGDTSDEIKQELITVIKNFWDCFAKEGVRRTILGYEFSIDTGDSPPVCCKQQAYGPHESKIIMEQVNNLKKNEWIRKCVGAWGSKIVLAAKPHQENITNIEDFIWRMCVSYRGLNAVTKPFTYPIQRCDDSIITLEQGTFRIYQISADADSGYHQVAVEKSSQDKLAFFAPDNDKYTFQVMPFGPMNAPSFYTAMMYDFKSEWDMLFIIKVSELPSIDGEVITVDEKIIHIGTNRLYYGTRSIIDDILIWSSNLRLTILYFRCVCMVFQKYRVSFKLKKCEFFKDRTEYVGYDVLSVGNSPAQSKFDMINDWNLPTTGQSLHSFIGLLSFYHRFAPYLEIRMKPLRKLCKLYYRKAIPLLAWTPELIQLFEDLKRCITSGPILARYDPSKPTFLKTDWSAEGMGWILMQPADDEESVRATELLRTTGECLFDLCKNGARLRPIAFGSRACTDMERKLHSFLGEVASGRWAISQNKRFLWGCHFYWLCDCSAVKEVIEYEGAISYVCRWSQELLGYHFDIVHRHNRMMVDVDSLTRRYGKIVAQHMAIAYALRQSDETARPQAYSKEAFQDAHLKSLPSALPSTKIFTESEIQHVCLYASEEDSSISSSSASIPCFMTSPLCIHQLQLPHVAREVDDSMQSFEQKSPLLLSALIIDDAASVVANWFQDFNASTAIWDTKHAFTASFLKNFKSMAYNESVLNDDILTNNSLANLQDQLSTFAFIDWTCATWQGLGIDWIQHAITIITAAFQHSNSNLQLCLLWIPATHFNGISTSNIQSLLADIIPNHLHFTCQYERASYWGESIDLHRFLITISTSNNVQESRAEFQPSEPRCILDSLNTLSLDPSALVPDIILPKSALEDLHSSNLFNSRIAGLTQKNLSCVSTSNMILDPMFPAREPSAPHQESSTFGCRFGIAIEQSEHVRVMKPSNSDMLSLFSIFPTAPTCEHLADADLNRVLRATVPCSMKSAIIQSILASVGFSENTYFGGEETVEATRCYFIKRPEESINWKDSYNNDRSTSTIIAGLRQHDEKTWSNEELQQIEKHYHSQLKIGSIRLVDGKLFLFKAIFRQIRYIGLIIVPEALRRPLFSHYHCGPTGGHMGEYKTLFRMRLRFHWPNMRTNIKDWVKGCPECIAHNVWRNKRNELYFSWPVTAPFYIMHLDLWQPGKLEDEKQNSIYLFNSMCDLTQFVVSSIIKNPNALDLAKSFMEKVLLSYGMCSVVVVDADSKFRSVFEDMCSKLKIMFWPLARGNHKGLSIEKYHRFLNKTQTIAGDIRGTHHTILQNYKLSQYGWNSAPIDNTDVSRSMAAIGREFQFPLDVELSPTPTLNDCQNSNLYEYLRAASNNGPFATSVISTLVEERREAHRLRHNDTKTAQKYEIGDAVTARVQIQSNAANGRVKKLSYQAKGPFQITAILDADSYEVQKYNEPNSAKRKYKGTDLYLLPPAIFPQDPLDTLDHRYLNFDHAPLAGDRHRALNIDLHNDTFFSLHGKEKLTTPTRTESVIDNQASKWHDIIPTTSELHHETKTTVPTPIESTTSPTIESSHIFNAINDSTDKVFFIKFLPQHTMRPRWYPVQIDMTSTIEANPQYKQNNKYWCVFLAKHPDDKNKSDQFARWWPDWYRYTKDDTTGIITYGQRVLVRPTVTPSSKTHIQWADLIALNEENVLVGPFDFQAITNINRARNTIEESLWTTLHQICLDNNLLPPTLGVHNSHRLNPRNLKRNTSRKKRKRKD